MRINIYVPNKYQFTVNEFQDIKQISKKYGITKIETGGIRGGAIDIVIILQFVLIWGSLEALKAYGKGFLGIDWFQKSGENFRKEINEDLVAIRNYVNELYSMHIKGKLDKKGAISINDSVEDFEIYVVINFPFMNEIMINNLPEDLLRAKLFLTNSEIEINHNHTVQIFPNKATNHWDYILIPSIAAYGNFIDNYYDFNNEKFHTIKSKNEFCEIFDLTDSENYKLLISPSLSRSFDDIGEI